MVQTLGPSLNFSTYIKCLTWPHGNITPIGGVETEGSLGLIGH